MQEDVGPGQACANFVRTLSTCQLDQVIELEVMNREHRRLPVRPVTDDAVADGQAAVDELADRAQSELVALLPVKAADAQDVERTPGAPGAVLAAGRRVEAGDL